MFRERNILSQAKSASLSTKTQKIVKRHIQKELDNNFVSKIIPEYNRLNGIKQKYTLNTSQKIKYNNIQNVLKSRNMISKNQKKEELNSFQQQKQHKQKKQNSKWMKKYRNKMKKKQKKKEVNTNENNPHYLLNDDEIKEIATDSIPANFVINQPWSEYKCPVKELNVGENKLNCRHCKARVFYNERLSSSTKKRYDFGICCSNGKVKLPPIIEPPVEIKKLYIQDDPHSKFFQKHIRAINCAFSMTSIGIKKDVSVMNVSKKRKKRKPVPPIFKINCVVHHYVGDLIPEKADESTFTQVYIHSEKKQVEYRLAMNGLGDKQIQQTSKKLLSKITHILNDVNPLVKEFKSAAALMKKKNVKEVELVLRGDIIPKDEHEGRYNLPTKDHIAVIIPKHTYEDEKKSKSRDIIIHGKKNGKLTKIDQNNQFYDPLQYVMFFPNGTFGWAKYINDGTKNKYTPRQHYAYRLFQRPKEFSAHLRGGMLTQQYVADQYAKVNIYVIFNHFSLLLTVFIFLSKQNV